ncbi:MAG: hypothetical protein OXE55_06645 [Flavobacteriaceae bacterium]|nr:hypothetical protein [Flavobacteriaceae bacterium]
MKNSELNKTKKYYGEVWFEETPTDKRFCVLSFKNDDIFIETNLSPYPTLELVHKIVGKFNGLGFCTLIECLIFSRTIGITENITFQCHYLYFGHSTVVDTKEMRISDFRVFSDILNKWIGKISVVDLFKEKLIKADFEDSYRIDKIQLDLSIHFCTRLQNSKKSNVPHSKITNIGYIGFKMEEPKSIENMIELYNQFKKVLHLIFSGVLKFNKIEFQCFGRDEWIGLYYNDHTLSLYPNRFVSTDYEEVKKSLPAILNHAYSNEIVKRCLHRLVENVAYNNILKDRLFINSISVYERLNKSNDKDKRSLRTLIAKNKPVFQKIGGISDSSWDSFLDLVINTRNYYVHLNTSKKPVFKDYHLPYVSRFFDYVTAYLMLYKLKGVEKLLLEKYIQKGNDAWDLYKRTMSD